MEMMKASLNGALDLKGMARNGMNWMHGQLEVPDKQDIDGVLMALRHVERRLLDRMEGIDDRLSSLEALIKDNGRQPQPAAARRKRGASAKP
jgi:hypothetical protein